MLAKISRYEKGTRTSDLERDHQEQQSSTAILIELWVQNDIIECVGHLIGLDIVNIHGCKLIGEIPYVIRS